MNKPVLLSRENGIGRITLNRPDALHALNIEMCQIVNQALNRWAADPDVHIVIVDHTDGTRGFCAGGDIAMLRNSGMGDASEARAFFAEEYRMNVAIKAFPKPYIAFIDGVTMGGGVGISVHGSHRVATERTLFAMPETGIGLFPDVGGGWFLPRLTGELGTWLALTGARLKGSDVAAAGVATHYIPSELVANLKSQILAADFSTGGAELLGEILKRQCHVVPEGSFVEALPTINACFTHNNAEEIVSSLEEAASEWAASQIDVIRSKSPETVKVALRQLREGAQAETFEENMQMEYRIGWRKVQSPDFIEGVRAVIIDKDQSPKWLPDTLEAVSDAHVAQFFEELGPDELNFT